QPYGYVNTPFTAPTPTPVTTRFDSPAPAATPTGATNLPPVPDDDDMGQGDERGFVYNAPALPYRPVQRFDQVRAADIHPPVQQVPGPSQRHPAQWLKILRHACRRVHGRIYQEACGDVGHGQPRLPWRHGGRVGRMV
ncbi:hypothetical protein AaE_000952, partial [Aphanomyces astaci]